MGNLKPVFLFPIRSRFTAPSPGRVSLRAGSTLTATLPAGSFENAPGHAVAPYVRPSQDGKVPTGSILPEPPRSGHTGQDPTRHAP
jgi:hypothetical protein